MEPTRIETTRVQPLATTKLLQAVDLFMKMQNLSDADQTELLRAQMEILRDDLTVQGNAEINRKTNEILNSLNNEGLDKARKMCAELIEAVKVFA